jgi:hypothetical protein
MTEAIAYAVTFHPSDPNLSPDDCMDTQTYATHVDAQIAIAEDARDTAAMHHAAGERAEWAAYALTSTHALTDALSDSSNHDAFPVQVRHGDNPRRIGHYLIIRIRIGDRLRCDECDGIGTVTDAADDGRNYVCDCPECGEILQHSHYPA